MTDWLLREQQPALELLKNAVASNGCAALIGALGMGKQAVLEGLLRSLDVPGVYVSMTDLAESCIGDDIDVCFYWAILEGLGAIESISDIPEKKDVWELYEWFSERMRERAPCVVSINDAQWFETFEASDTDRIPDIDQFEWGKWVFRNLTSLVESDVQIVLAGTSRLEAWAKEMLSADGRAGLWDLIQRPVTLSALPLEAVKNAFSDYGSLPSHLIELCGGHPYCLRRLTEKIDFETVPVTQVLLDEVDRRVNNLRPELDQIFIPYWESYTEWTRQACFLLVIYPHGLSVDSLRPKLGNITDRDFNYVVAEMERTGVIYKSPGSGLLRVIGLFRRWYKKRMGFLDGVLSPSSTVESLPDTELTFFPNHDLVLVRRGRFLYTDKLKIDADTTIPRLCAQVRQIPASDKDQFSRGIQYLSQQLWDLLKDCRWFKEVVDNPSEHRLRFNVPADMGEFPFELLPWDKEGTKRIGVRYPLSRQLMMEGQRVERAPLVLPRRGGELRLRILVVAPEVGGEISIDKKGRVHRGMAAMALGGLSFKLDNLRLGAEVEKLDRIFRERRDLIGEVVFLARGDTLGEMGSIEVLDPTGEKFQEVLSNRMFDVFHFVGHGLFVSGGADEPKSGGLVFEDMVVNLRELKQQLEGQRELDFVYLSCCESGKMDSNVRTSDLLGLSHACVEAGVPAVLGMRWPITVSVSSILTAAFYRAFFEEGILDRASHRAIEAIDREGDPARSVYAAAPVLIMH